MELDEGADALFVGQEAGQGGLVDDAQEVFVGAQNGVVGLVDGEVLLLGRAAPRVHHFGDGVGELLDLLVEPVVAEHVGQTRWARGYSVGRRPSPLNRG